MAVEYALPEEDTDGTTRIETEEGGDYLITEESEEGRANVTLHS